MKKNNDKVYKMMVGMDRRDNREALDCGYIIYKDQVLVNIYNVF